MAMATADPTEVFTQFLANPAVSLLLRIALGVYVVLMARGFYKDPFAYFRRWMPNLIEQPWLRQFIRGTAVFCVWGGCFIVSTALATELLNFHGLGWALVLMAFAACLAYFLLPGSPATPTAATPGDDHAHRWK